MPTIPALAAQLDPRDPGATAEAICGFLGHLNGPDLKQAMTVGLTPEDEADVRFYFARTLEV